MADTTALLHRLREHVARVQASDRYAASDVGRDLAAQLFIDLDTALAGGDTLPLDWTPARKPNALSGIQPTWATDLFGPPPDDEPMTEI